MEMAPSEKKYKHLLLKERAASEQHRLNYEKLKALTIKFQLENASSNLMSKKSGENGIDKGFACVQQPHSSKITILPVEAKMNPKLSSDSHENEKNHSLANTSTKEKINPRVATRKTAIAIGKGEVEQNLLSAESPSLAVSHWKAQYASLLQEYQNYKIFADAVMKSNIATSVEEVRKENERIKEEYELTNSQLNNTCAELRRSIKALQGENKTLLEELDESRLKLEDKTAQYESLVKKMDGISLPKEEFNKDSHKQLQSRLTASETKSAFFKGEIEETHQNNKMLQEEILYLKNTHEEEVREMKALLVCVYNSCIGEKYSLQNKYKEVSAILNSQQAYVEEIDGFIKARDKENNHIIDEVCQNLKRVVVDGKNALEVIEGKLHTTVAERKQLEEDLAKALAFMEEIKNEAKLHQEFTSNFLKRLYDIIGTPNLQTSSTAAEPTDSLTIKLNDGKSSQRIREENNLEMAMKQLRKWKGGQDLKKYRQESRLVELERLLKTDRSKVVEDNKNLRKKCKHYQRKIKDLKRKRRRNDRYRPIVAKYKKSQNIHNDANQPTRGSFGESTTTLTFPNSSTDLKINSLLEKHLHFGKILSTVTPDIDEKYKYSKHDL